MSQEKRESFVFYRSFYEVMENMNDSDKSELIDMICENGLNRRCRNSDSVLATQLFTLIKPQLDANYRKAINGKKGGRPKND